MAPCTGSTLRLSSPRSIEASSNPPRASMPSPALERPRNARRVNRWLFMFIASIPGDGLVQVQYRPRHGRQSSELGRINILRRRMIADRKQRFGRALVILVVGEMLAV